MPARISYPFSCVRVGLDQLWKFFHHRRRRPPARKPLRPPDPGPSPRRPAPARPVRRVRQVGIIPLKIQQVTFFRILGWVWVGEILIKTQQVTFVF